MSKDSRDRTIEIIGNHHDQLASFAKKSYELDGRGLIHVEFPNVPRGMTVIGQVMMKYVGLEEARGLIGGDEDGQITLRMIETYDPTRQAVVLAGILDENPISIKMRLELPFMVDDPGGTH